MNNIRKIITERLENEKFQNLNEYSSLHTYGFNEGINKALEVILNLLPAPRTEQDILNDFERLGWKVTQNDDSCMIICFNGFARIVILKCAKQYAINNLCNMQEHKLLHELFTVWGWLDE